MLGQVISSPQLLVAGPHALPSQALTLSGTQHEFAPTPPAPQNVPPGHLLGQVMGRPQLLVAGPQVLFAHAVTSSASQPHAFLPAPPPPHVFGCGHRSGQSTIVPQLFVAGPHALVAQVVVLLSGLHVHVVGVPLQVSPGEQAPHRSACSQPLFASVGTHSEPHFFVFGPQAPTTHVLPLQTSVPVPGSGQLVPEQPTSVQP